MFLDDNTSPKFKMKFSGINSFYKEAGLEDYLINNS
jgi:hypothetical protein